MCCFWLEISLSHWSSHTKWTGESFCFLLSTTHLLSLVQRPHYFWTGIESTESQKCLSEWISGGQLVQAPALSGTTQTPVEVAHGFACLSPENSQDGEHTALLDSMFLYCITFLVNFFPDAQPETFSLQFVAVAPCCIIWHYRELSFPLCSYSPSIFVTIFQAAVGCSFLPSIVFYSPLGQGDSLIFLKTLDITHPSRSYSNDSRYMHITLTRPGFSSEQQRLTQNLAGKPRLSTQFNYLFILTRVAGKTCWIVDQNQKVKCLNVLISHHGNGSEYLMALFRRISEKNKNPNHLCMVSSEETKSAPQIQHQKLGTEMWVLPS